MRPVTGPVLLIAALAAHAQQPPPDFTDPVALLKAVAKNYAKGADTFRMEAISETTKNSDLHHEWRKVYQTAVKGPRNLYRIEARTAFGSMIQDSDGANEWVYSVEGNMYMKRPVPENWPQFSSLMANIEVMAAWQMRMSLESVAAGYKEAAMLPEQTISIEGRRFSCYVVHTTGNDRSRDYYEDTTFWIDKTAVVFRKQVKHISGYVIDGANGAIRIPYLEDSTTVYPVADWNPQIAPDTFIFNPPAGAKEVSKLEPDYYTAAPSSPKTDLTGQAAPDASFTASDGSQVPLSSFRGKPVLLDLWATWCGPCIASMPAFDRIYKDVQDKGIAVVTADQDEVVEGAAEYLARHEYSWTNYHDLDRRVAAAFKKESIPMTILIDAQGKIVYYGSGGDEAAVRKAIAALGPEFASIAR